jgi:hypothetical protein
MTIAIQQLAQIINLHTQFLAFVRIADPHSASSHLYQLRGGLDVCSSVYGVLGT